MTSGPTFTILLPINRPPDLVPHALGSVLGQSRQDFELFIICDGAPAATVEAAHRFEAEDPRVRAFAHPKGERHGEAWRHAALQEARGRIICQIGDDDLWFPDHLAEVAGLMATADFGNTLPLFINGGGDPIVHFGDLGDPEIQRLMSTGPHNIFGPTPSAYRLEAYRALPVGWSPAPEGTWTDLWMWRKFLALPGIRLRTRFTATTLTFPAALRSGWSLERRREEIAGFAAAIGSQGAREDLWQRALGELARRYGAMSARTVQMQATGRHLVQAIGEADDALTEIVALRGDTEAQALRAQAAVERLPDRDWRRRLLGPPATGVPGS